jgi:hypothetical protein
MPNDHTARGRVLSTSFKQFTARGTSQDPILTDVGPAVAAGGTAQNRGRQAAFVWSYREEPMQVQFCDAYPFRPQEPVLRPLLAAAHRVDAAVAFVTRPGVALLREYLSSDDLRRADSIPRSDRWNGVRVCSPRRFRRITPDVRPFVTMPLRPRGFLPGQARFPSPAGAEMARRRLRSFRPSRPLA